MLAQVFGEQTMSVWRALGHREVNEQVHRKNPRGQVPQQGEGELPIAEMKKTGLGFSGKWPELSSKNSSLST